MDVLELLKGIIAQQKHINLYEVEVNRPFMEYGLDSKQIVSISGKLERVLGMDLSPTLLLDYPTIELLYAYLMECELPKEESRSVESKKEFESVSIIGMSCKFPKANSIHEFRDNLIKSKDCVVKISKYRLDLINEIEDQHNDSIFDGGYLSDIDKFDYQYFGLSIEEALHMDPQQRLLLQEVVHALENANMNGADLQEHTVGVFVGACNFDYMRKIIGHTLDINAIVGNSPAMISNRVSYIFNFTGPSMTIDTACSSSLVAVQEAIKSLMNQECDLAIAAGVNLILDLSINEGLGKANMLSNMGKCFTFDERANGYVRGEGIGVVILQKESDAINENHRIYANILGGSINQDGRSASITAPKKSMQVQVIRQAWLQTGLDKRDIEYVEAHGTGTELGDAIEIAALDEAYECSSRKKGLELKIGAVKTNLGHLEGASGIAGLIKLALSIYNNDLYPVINLEHLNQKLGLSYRNIKVIEKMQKWESEKRIGAVSSFGFGGTNCHVILGKSMNGKRQSGGPNAGVLETKPLSKDNDGLNYYVIPITAASACALRNRISAYLNYFMQHTVNMEALESKLLYHMDWLSYRICYVASDMKELQEKMRRSLELQSFTEKAKSQTIAFLFSGQGTQWKGMIKGLFRFSKFKEVFQRCRDLFLEIQQVDLQELLEGEDFQRTLYMQPLLFSVQVSLFEFLKWIGIQGQIVYGHSLGEVAAAYASGAISLKQGVTIICCRSVILDQFTGKGEMVSVALTEDEVNRIIQNGYKDISVAVINDASSVVVAGEKEEIKKLKQQLESQKIWYHLLPVNYAFHYPGLEPYVSVLEEQLSGMRPLPTRVKFVSTVTGDVVKSSELDNRYWAKNMRNKVEFSKASKVVMEECNMVIEVGASTALLPYLSNDQSKNRRLVSLQRRNTDCVRSLYEAIAEMFNFGVTINWRTIIKEVPAELELPFYAFDEKPCWMNRNSEEDDHFKAHKWNSLETVQEFFLDFLRRNAPSPIKIGNTLSMDEIPLDSLKIFQLRSMIHDQYGIQLELKDLVSHASIDALSKYVFERLSGTTHAFKQEKLNVIKPIDRLVTDNQKAIALDQWLNKSNSKYNIPFLWRFEESIDRQLWEKAYFEVMNSHIALRTVYTFEHGSIFQKEVSEPNQILHVKRMNEDEIRAYAHREINLPFQLEESVCRGVLLEALDGTFYFLLLIHHIAIDGISMYLLMQQLVKTYQVSKKGEVPHLHRDDSYTNFQQRLFIEKENQTYEDNIKYWTNLLGCSHYAQRFQLPATLGMDQVSGTEGLIVQIEKDTLVKLYRAANKLKVSNFSILYSVYQLMVNKISGETDFVTCTYFSSRKYREEMETVGYMVQPLYSRAVVEKEYTGANYIKKMYEQLLQGYEKTISVSELNRILEGDGQELSHVFVYEKAPIAEEQSLFILKEDRTIEIQGMKVRALKSKLDTSQYDLVMMFEESQKTIIGKMEYEKRAYSADSVRTLRDLFLHLLEEVLTRLEEEIQHYSLLPKLEEERVKLMLKGDDSEKLEGLLFHDYLVKAAGIHGDKLAAVYGDTTITYRELDKRSNQLASYLLKRTRGDQVAIGVCMKKSIDFLIAIFGVMKCGCYYIPLDYHYPRQRLQYIKKDSRMQYIISDSSGRLALSDTTENEHIELSEIAEESDGAVNALISCDDMAYAIYTSGSTGRPKGVLVTHRGIENVVRNQQRLFNIMPEDRICFFASISFDASVFEILMGIGHGATLYFDQLERMGTGKLLQQFLNGNGITVATLPASVLESMENQGLNQLRIIVTAGEPCSQSVKDKWAGNHRFFNAYGVTEATIWNTTEECVVGESVNIGNSVSHTQLSIVNGESHSCPVGIPGELLIAGTGLSKGYIGLESLNQTKFQCNDYGTVFYRTGDFVRLGYNHKIEYLGRLDNQVKLRGFRIELEEIQEVIQSHEGVTSSIVVKDQSDRMEQLIAFVKLEESIGRIPVEEELKTYIGNYLPHYMVPSRIITVDEWKLTVNGKIDRIAMMEEVAKRRVTPLRGSNAPDTTGDGSGVGPNLLDYVSHVTGTHVSEEDHILKLGMNSIMVFEMISFIHDTFHIDMDFRQVMESSSISELLDIINKGNHAESPLVLPCRENARIPISDKQKGIWLECSMNPANTDYNIPVVFKVNGRIDVPLFTKSVRKLIEAHDILHTEYAYGEDGIIGEIVGNFAEKFEDCVESIDISYLDDQGKSERIHNMIERMQKMGFDVSKVPLFKVVLLQSDKDEWYLMLTIHHIIADGWTVNLMLQQLSEIYLTLLSGEEYTKKSSFQYGNYVTSAKNQERGNETDFKNYWIQKLGEAPKVELASISDRARAVAHQGENIELTLNPEVVNKINEFSKDHQISVSALMLGAYTLTLHNFSGIDAITVGIPNIGRQTKEELGIVGMFLDTLVAKITIQRNQTVIAYLKEVMKEVLDSYNYRLSYEELLHCISANGKVSGKTLFQVMFNMINFEMSVSSFAGIPMDIVQNENLNAKFDITMYVLQQPEFMKIRLNYLSNLYPRPVMYQFLQDYVSQLTLLVEHPHQSLLHCYPKMVDERTVWNDREGEGEFRNFTDLIWKKTQDDGLKPWILFDSKNLTYRDFADHLSKLQEVLQKAEVRKGDCLGIIAHRTKDLIPAVFHVLHSGIAFVLIDGMLPLERIKQVITSTGTTVVLDLRESTVECSRFAPRDTENLSVDYRLVTSGTTGQPKCVIGRNESLSHFVQWEVSNFKLTEKDRFSFLSGISHDPIMRDILVPLYLQATIALPEKPNLVDTNLFDYFKENRITVSHLTPTIAEILLLHSGFGDRRLEEVKFLFLGGEPLTKDLALRLLKLCPNGTVVNYYGASETPQAMLYAVYNGQNIEHYGDRLPVGKGIADVKGFIANEDFVPCRPFHYGEILLKTPYLSKGYLRDDQETHIKFIKDTENRGSLIYRTGDYGYQDEEGRIYFLNRKDRVVKILGHRMDLQEIQGIFNQYKDVLSNCAVVYQEELCSFLVTADAFKASDFKRWIKEHCPEYMQPKKIIQVDTIPITANGKIDVQPLLKLLLNSNTDVKKWLSSEGKESQTNKVIKEIWSKLLKTEDIDINDKFFEIGGDSFKAVQLQYELKKYFGRDVDIITIFNYPTILSFTRYMEEKMKYETTTDDRAAKMKRALSGIRR